MHNGDVVIFKLQNMSLMSAIFNVVSHFSFVQSLLENNKDLSVEKSYFLLFFLLVRLFIFVWFSFFS